MFTDITGIILAGGKSTRMGQNKSFLKINNETIIERTLSLMNRNFKDVILITNSPKEYNFLNIPIFEDIIRGKGPLSGIHSGLVNSPSEKNFIVSCDIPLIDSGIIKFITNYPSEDLIKISRADGYIQQLCGVYSKKVIPLICEIFDSGQNETVRIEDQKKRKCEVLSVVKRANGKIIEIETEYPGYRKHSFVNMNRAEDYSFVLEIVDSYSQMGD
ncbi:MAG: molybdenum cofactor guanylyltransferase [Ignavibacteriaceae bacterium]|nr:molybdenum cofactor guanylyltransferase [Ignavibacteriaceae bacterium]